jgi:hypothetical protein
VTGTEAFSVVAGAIHSRRNTLILFRTLIDLPNPIGALRPQHKPNLPYLSK